MRWYGDRARPRVKHSNLEERRRGRASPSRAVMDAPSRIQMNQRWYEGKTALITGASSSMGRAFAQALAARGTHLILVDRSQNTLPELAATLSKVHAVHVEVMVADLSQEGAVQQIPIRVDQLGRRVDVLVNNAGFGTEGPFEMRSPEFDLQHVLLPAVALVDLTSAFLPAMLARGRGMVINVVPTAAFQPLLPMAVSGATKAFVLSFSQALRAECRKGGVRVLVLFPGIQTMAFFKAKGPEAVKLKPVSTLEFGVKSALRAARRGQGSVIPGRFKALLVHGIWWLLWLENRACSTVRVRRASTSTHESEAWL